MPRKVQSDSRLTTESMPGFKFMSDFMSDFLMLISCPISRLISCPVSVSDLMSDFQVQFCVYSCCLYGLRMKFLLKTDSVYPRDAKLKLLYSPWQTPSIPSALTPIGQFHQSPPSPVLGDRARGKRRGFSHGAAAPHSQHARVHTEFVQNFPFFQLFDMSQADVG